MDAMNTLLIVDDETAVQHFFERVLQRDGFQVAVASDGETALRLIAAREFDLVLLDLQLKGIGGLDVLAELRRQWPATPVIIITAHASLDTAIKALRQGAHDYLIKPCRVDDLRASIQAGLLKRQQDLQRRESSASGDSAPSIEPDLQAPRPVSVPSSGQLARPIVQNQSTPSKGLSIDSIRHAVTLDTSRLELSPIEFAIVTYLVNESPRVVSAKELAREVQGYISVPEESRDTIRSHIYHIRAKMKSAAERDVIRTVRGVGYAIDE